MTRSEIDLMPKKLKEIKEILRAVEVDMLRLRLSLDYPLPYIIEDLNELLADNDGGLTPEIRIRIKLKGGK